MVLGVISGFVTPLCRRRRQPDIANADVQVLAGAAWCVDPKPKSLTMLFGTCRCCQCLWESRAAWAVVRRLSRGRQACQQPPTSAWCTASGAPPHQHGPMHRSDRTQIPIVYETAGGLASSM